MRGLETCPAYTRPDVRAFTHDNARDALSKLELGLKPQTGTGTGGPREAVESSSYAVLDAIAASHSGSKSKKQRT